MSTEESIIIDEYLSNNEKYLTDHTFLCAFTTITLVITEA